MRIVNGDAGSTALEIDSDTPSPATGPYGILPPIGYEGGLCGSAIQTAGKPGAGVLTATVAAASVPILVYDQDLPVSGVHFKKAKVATEVGDADGTLAGSGSVLPWIGTQTGTCKVKLKRTSASTPSISPGLSSLCLSGVGA